ncbi:putative glycoside hydrolase, family 18 [Gottschalkia acidurici 9a]|uniref:chitinase n=1 Tax=Gottschalkia acidurici (strain ATCC 7906 / DSM 604 / BCRC 14475 / CIP 104303 / KCTC 5404 / NCIMB 10678 / 9a) TaxID=1128398 RepID=K0AZA5_GOTA9|nr:glycoside hydrolase family 18 protein [Gottschalkia acidurici]AFS78030.1 putative glycoside hydrolase, family 18 [Gottschalkia acidurici 9a]
MFKNKKFYCIALALICVMSLATNFTYALSKSDEEFKVIGYYSEIFDDPIEGNIQFDKLTHIIYAFLIPREDGSLVELEKPEKLKELVEKGHENNVKIIIAVGGWLYQNMPLAPNFEKMASTYESRKVFIDNLMDFIDEYNVDGVEIDWEHPTLGQSAQNYESLVVEMSDRLKEKGKSLTAALNGAWSNTEGPEASKAISAKCLEKFDWISVMAYDMNNEQHSPVWFANTSIQYWLNRNVPKRKIAIGMPLYALPSWKQYRHLVEENRENAYKDYVKGDPLDSHYNGINTIKEKLDLHLKQLVGLCYLILMKILMMIQVL